MVDLLASWDVRTHRRPHVDNDNPYSEAEFTTLKYCPASPERFAAWHGGDDRVGRVEVVRDNEVGKQRVRSGAGRASAGRDLTRCRTPQWRICRQ